MLALRPSGKSISDREQVRSALVGSFHEVIKGTAFSENDELAARALLDAVTYVLSVQVPNEALDDRAQITTFTRNEALRFEMYLREHLLRRITSAVLPLTEAESIPTQPSADEGCD